MCASKQDAPSKYCFLGKFLVWAWEYIKPPLGPRWSKFIALLQQILLGWPLNLVEVGLGVGGQVTEHQIMSPQGTAFQGMSVMSLGVHRATPGFWRPKKIYASPADSSWDGHQI